jgi:hypothetical protein
VRWGGSGASGIDLKCFLRVRSHGASAAIYQTYQTCQPDQTNPP